MKEYYYSIKGMINNTKVNRQLAKKNFLATALTMSLLLILASSIVNLSIFEQAYAIKEFNVNVDIEDNEIKRGDTQHITVNVRNDDTDNEVSGANVKLTVYPPDSDSTSANDKTDKNGKATFDVDIDGNAETGTYDVEIKVSKDGYNTKTVNTSFDVVGSNSHDRNDNDHDHGNDDNNGGGNNDASSSSAAASVSSGSDSGNGAASGSSSSNNFSNEDNGDNEDGSSASSSSSAAAASSGASSSAAAAAGSAAASAAAAGDDASSAASSAVSENGGSSSAAAAAASAAASASSSGNDNDDNGDSSSSSAASSTGGEDD